ncbi:hypothetical protein [Mesorhizobium sp. ISC25]|uniref:hypothetical protein n=1 Tax=Mesorhizobium sp. ISC25 TaxID=3077335 RepID=UPI0035D5EA18
MTGIHQHTLDPVDPFPAGYRLQILGDREQGGGQWHGASGSAILLTGCTPPGSGRQPSK